MPRNDDLGDPTPRRGGGHDIFWPFTTPHSDRLDSRFDAQPGRIPTNDLPDAGGRVPRYLQFKIGTTLPRFVEGTNFTLDYPSSITANRAALEQFDKLVKYFDFMIPEFNQYIAICLMNALIPTFELSQTYCPTASGRLKGSGYLETVRAIANQAPLGEQIDQGAMGNPDFDMPSAKFDETIKVVMGYAKNNEPMYAGWVHENLEWKHKPPTKAKFLQSAIEEDLFNIQDRFQKNMGDFFGGG